MLTIFWTLNKAGLAWWLAYDEDAGALWAVPNRKGGWRERRRYTGRVWPTNQSRVCERLARIVAHVTGMPGAEPLEASDRTWLELSSASLALVARQEEAS